MTTLRNIQMPTINVSAAPPTIQNIQLANIAIASNPAAAGLRAIQLAYIMVIANGQRFQPLGPVIGLNCWTPCGTLMWNGV
jgi:hypothetical protein